MTGIVQKVASANLCLCLILRLKAFALAVGRFWIRLMGQRMVTWHLQQPALCYSPTFWRLNTVIAAFFRHIA